MPRAGKYTLHNKHGFLSAHGDRVDARADAHEHNEWSLEKHGDYWLVSAYNSHKLASDAHGTVRLHAESHADSHFQIEDHDQERKIAVRDTHGRFLTVDAHGHIKTVASDDGIVKDDWWWSIEPAGHHHHGQHHHVTHEHDHNK